MAVIHTKRNLVLAYEPLDRDLWVKTLIGNRQLLMQTIDQYQAAVDWAVSMADQFDDLLTVLPIDIADLQNVHSERLERAFGGLTPEERFQLCREVVTTVAEVMRDCDDADVRANAHEVLKKMRVV
jgi:hypothetical protein